MYFGLSYKFWAFQFCLDRIEKKAFFFAWKAVVIKRTKIN